MKLRSVKTTTLKGLAVLLPSIVLVALLMWIGELLWNFARPLGSVVSRKFDMAPVWSTSIVLLAFAGGCYLLGRIVSTVVGSKMRHLLETNVLDRAPGYSVLRNVFGQLFGTEESPLRSFSMVRFENAGVRISGFLVDRSDKGWCTVFIPTAPNPTSGFILHVREEKVEALNVSPADAIETIIGCGAGSEAFHDKLDGGPAFTKEKPGASGE